MEIDYQKMDAMQHNVNAESTTMVDSHEKRILVIDDDDVIRESIKRLLKTQPYLITEAESSEQAKTIIENNTFDCILLDYRLDDMDGIELMPAIQASNDRPCPVIMITAYSEERLIVEALRNGFYDYINKSHLDAKVLLSVINASFRWTELQVKLQEAQQKLETLSMYDSLTGLPNRNLFFDRLAQAKLNATRSHKPFALLMLDLNLFKQVNDTHGHAVGDHLLKDVAGRLKKIARKSDTYARLGGDEFAVILHDIQTETDITQVVDKIVKQINIPFSIEGHTLHIGVAIGGALFKEGMNESLLLEQADASMYKAKKANRAYELFTDNDVINTQPKLEIGSYIASGIQRNEFYLNFQPQVDLVTGECCGLEVLSRWHSHSLGIVSPDDFIRASERSNVIWKLSYHIFEMAFKQMRAWAAQGLHYPMSINLSAKLLEDEYLLDNIHGYLRRYEIDPQQLTFEITETALMDNVVAANEKLDIIAGMGIKISIDDFGTGYTSFKYLREYASHEIKVDKVFVINLPSNARDASIVQSFISLATGFKTQLIAEGVESAEILMQLKAMGCMRAQGYWIARPMLAENIPLWVKDWDIAEKLSLPH